MEHILLVEDDISIAEMERDFLTANGFDVTIIDNGDDDVSEALSQVYDLVLLDVMLPKKDGFQVCREIRDQIDVPILMVTAKTSDVDKVLGIGLGADDYITKPFSLMELVARVKGKMKRYERLKAVSHSAAAEQVDPHVIRVDDLVIDENSYRIFRGEEELHLTSLEFNLVAFLARNKGVAFTKDQIFEHVWGMDAEGDSTNVIVAVKRLREKLERDPANPYYIETVWGVGYRFVVA